MMARPGSRARLDRTPSWSTWFARTARRLRSVNDEYFVAAIVAQNGKATVAGVQVGDRVAQIGSLRVSGATRQIVFDAMHGRSGERRTLLLERQRKSWRREARVTAF